MEECLEEKHLTKFVVTNQMRIVTMNGQSSHILNFELKFINNVFVH